MAHTDSIITIDGNSGETTRSIDIFCALVDENISLSTAYIKQMKKVGILDEFLAIVKHESKRNQQLTSVLAKFGIKIDPQFYRQLIRHDLLTPLVEAVKEIHYDKQVKELGSLKRSYDESDANGNEEDHSSKQLKLTQEYLTDPIPELFSLPSLNNNEDDE
ncbi:unnamed protein product [Adineta ricciae]|uniref:Uncharacterized protein n=1 Tax=Adineta ricciae TaxID=249248 RepID=A0A814Z251_ADIRI|nr:unnamed protein product [Adineta ricciae]CAF1502037.1 unnamed protein product [Adineta ricciae]